MTALKWHQENHRNKLPLLDVQDMSRTDLSLIFFPLSRLFLCIATCSVEVYECLAADVIVETLAAVLFQLNLFDGHIFSHHLVPLFPSKEAVSKHAIYCDWQTLLSDLVSSLKQENTIQKNSIKK